MKFKKFWNWLKKYKWMVLIILSLGSFALIISMLSINWTNLKIIYAAGSSAVAPLVEALNVEFQIANKGILVDMNVSPTGSGNGIEVAATGQKHLGNVSRSPRISEAGLPAVAGNEAVHGSFSEDWNKRKLKTITLGWDAIAVIYKSSSNAIIDVNSDTIGLIYETVSGTKTHTLADFVSDADNLKLIPYARTGGAIKSGTTDAFITTSNLSFDKSEYENAIDALEHGQYGNDVVTTKESNIETWMQIRNGPNGAITYLSGGFVLSNLNEISRYGFKVATYNGLELASDVIANGYNWFRPLNTITSIDVVDFVKTWIIWVIDPNNNFARNVFDACGIIPLSPEQINSMCSGSFSVEQPENFWISDYELIETQRSSEPSFGAVAS